MEKCIISAATIAGKHFCPHLPVQNPRISRDAVAAKSCTYGMADNRIGVARLDLPDILPTEGVADSP